MNDDILTVGPASARAPARPKMDSTGDGPTRPVSITHLSPRDRGVLIRMSGSETGRLHSLLGDTWTLGRGRTCSVQFDDVTLSRVHARIVREGTRYVIEDNGSLNGTYVNDARVTRAVLEDGDRVRLGSGASLRFQVVDAEEEKALTRMYESSIRDGLTGVLNRRQLEERIAAELSSAVRRGAALSVIIVDLDHFKRINDSHGHLAGDATLRRVVEIIGAVSSKDDVVGRYGGEEFVVVARGTSLDDARLLAERIRAAVAAAEIAYGDQTLAVTMSAGVASRACVGPSCTVPALLACADARLYTAKSSGRNRVVAG